MGRHREFELDEALDAAMLVFWRKGFEGTSFDDLTTATGVARPGLYAAFGNKEKLFHKVLDRYEARFMDFVYEALRQPTVRKVIERILHGFADVLTAVPDCHGCLGINGAIACSQEAEPIRLELVGRRLRAEQALTKRFKAAVGELPEAISAPTLARLVMAVTQGMAVQAKGGATRAQLREMADGAMVMCRRY